LLNGKLEVMLEGGDNQQADRILQFIDKFHFVGAVEFVNKSRHRKAIDLESMEDAVFDEEEPLSQVTIRSALPNCEYLTWDFDDLRILLR
jgi:hypothetical protein